MANKKKNDVIRGQLLTLALAALGWTSKDLAAALPVSLSTVHKWEAGLNGFSEVQARRVAKLLNRSPTFFDDPETVCERLERTTSSLDPRNLVCRKLPAGHVMILHQQGQCQIVPMSLDQTLLLMKSAMESQFD